MRHLSHKKPNIWHRFWQYIFFGWVWKTKKGDKNEF